jgi:hypothetical protein
MLMGIAKVLGGIILTGVGVVAAAMGAGVTGDGIAETLNGGSAGSSVASILWGAAHAPTCDRSF